MFDIGLSEIMVIAVVALIVIGPERLPKVARTLGHLWGRVQRYVNGVKADISRDMALDELRQAQQTLTQEAASTEQALNLVSQELGQQVEQLNSAIVNSDQSYTEQILRSINQAPAEPKIPVQQKFLID